MKIAQNYQHNESHMESPRNYRVSTNNYKTTQHESPSPFMQNSPRIALDFNLEINKHGGELT